MVRGLEYRLKTFLKRHSEIEQRKGKFHYKNSPFFVRLPTGFSEELCRLLGVIHGDGNISNSRILVCDKCKKYHNTVKELFEDVFEVTPNIFHDKNRNTYYSHIKRKAVYLFLVEVLEVPRGSVRKNLLFPSYN